MQKFLNFVYLHKFPARKLCTCNKNTFCRSCPEKVSFFHQRLSLSTSESRSAPIIIYTTANISGRLHIFSIFDASYR